MDTKVASCRLLVDEKAALDALAKRSLCTSANMLASVVRKYLQAELSLDIYDPSKASQQPQEARCPYPEGDPRREPWLLNDTRTRARISNNRQHRNRRSTAPVAPPLPIPDVSVREWVSTLRSEAPKLCRRGDCPKCDGRWPLVYRVIADPPRTIKDLVPLLELEKKQKGETTHAKCKNR